MLGHTRHVVEELRGGVSAKIGTLDFCRRQIGHERLDVIYAVIDDAN